MEVVVGSQFGSLVVIARGPLVRANRTFLCRCACGTEKLFRRDKLPMRKSCGCVRRAQSARISAGFPRPSRSRKTGRKRVATVTSELKSTYGSYSAMRSRCAAKTGARAKVYSGNGVRVCAQWLSSFDQFVADMGLRPSPQHSIDRFPDPSGNYEPGNCRWATMVEQQRNRRNCLKIPFCGQLMTASEIAEVTGLNSDDALYRQIRKMHGRKRAQKAA